MKQTNKPISQKNSKPQKGPPPKDPEVKYIGDNLLRHIRFVISKISGDNDDLYFKLNRWIYSRLQNDERNRKNSIKQKLWNAGMQKCRSCGKVFSSLKGTELHRKDDNKGYILDNCELLCSKCHKEKHNKSK